MKTKSIQMFYLFISHSPISVTLWDVSISGCLSSPSNIDVKSPLASVKQSDSSTSCLCPCFSLESHSLLLIWILHHDFSYSVISLLFLLWLFFFHPSIIIYLLICKSDTTFSSALYCFRPACRTSIKLRLVDSTQSVLPWSLFLTTACLSLCQGTQSPCLSISVLSFNFLFLSVCLTCQQLSWCSRVAVNQVLVSVLLSVHLPVKASQIRHVILPPGFPLLQDGFIKKSTSRKCVIFTQMSKLIVAFWNVLIMQCISLFRGKYSTWVQMIKFADVCVSFLLSVGHCQIRFDAFAKQ